MSIDFSRLNALPIKTIGVYGHKKQMVHFLEREKVSKEVVEWFRLPPKTPDEDDGLYAVLHADKLFVILWHPKDSFWKVMPEHIFCLLLRYLVVLTRKVVLLPSKDEVPAFCVSPPPSPFFPPII